MQKKPSYLLLLNAAEGFLQLVLGEVLPPNLDGSVPQIPQQTSGLIFSQEWRLPSQGAELLTPILQSSFARLGITAKEIGWIGCVSGPGSFTGIRLTVSSAAGFARSHKMLQGGLPFMPVLAYNVQTMLANTGSIVSPSMEKASYIWIFTHARRNLIHAQKFFSTPKNDGLTVTATTEVLVLSVEEAINTLKEENIPVILAGSGVTKNELELKKMLANSDILDKVIMLPEVYNMPQPSTLFQFALHSEFTKKDIDPNYIRKSDAEENLEKISASLQIDPLQAHKQYQKLTNNVSVSSIDK